MNNTEQPLRAAFYIRVSTEDQVERYGVGLQKEALRAAVKSKGKLSDGRDSMIFAGEEYIYTDDGVSGTVKLEDRPAFGRLKEDILNPPEDSKPFDCVVVYKIDRFARKLKILLDVVDFFDRYGIQFLSATESIDTSTPFGKAVFGIIGVIAELELETIKQRTQGGRLQAIKDGKYMGATPPFGYKKDIDGRLVVLPEEAEVVKMIFEMFVDERQSIQSITTHLTNNGYISPAVSAEKYKKSAKKAEKKNPIFFWRSDAVRNILVDEIYIGKHYYDKTKNGKSLPKDKWRLSPYEQPSIIDKVTFEKAQRLYKELRFITPGKGSTEKHIYLLSGLLRCDCCYDLVRDKEGRISWHGERKEIKKGSSLFTYFYKCKRKNKAFSAIECASLPLPADEIENYIVDRVKELLKNPLAVYNYQAKLKSTENEIRHFESRKLDFEKLLNNLPHRRQRLKEQHEMGLIGTSELTKRFRECEDSESRLKEQINNLAIQISQDTLSKGYLKSLELFNDKYAKSLEDIYGNREEVYRILHLIVSQIIIYSRPLKVGDIVAGKKKAGQKIPYKIALILKLPQDYLQELYKKIDDKSVPHDTLNSEGETTNEQPKFGVKTDKW